MVADLSRFETEAVPPQLVAQEVSAGAGWLAGHTACPCSPCLDLLLLQRPLH